MRLSSASDSTMLLFVKSAFVIATALLLVGCQNRKAAMSDADFEAFKSSHPGMTGECLNAVRFGRDWASTVDDPNCFAMLPQQRWSGLWATNGEYSTFCPDPAKECGMPNRGITLRFTERSYFKKPPPLGLYHIEFVGRRTKVPGYHGQLDVYAHLLVVDRLISLQAIPGQKYTKLF